MKDHTIWYGTVFLIVCVMLAKCHNCPTSEEKIVYKEAKEYKKPQVNPEVSKAEIAEVYYWKDSKKQCDPAQLWGGGVLPWQCDHTSASISSTYNTLTVICRGLKSKGKTGTVLFSVHRDDNEKAFYLKKLVDPSSVLDYTTKETRYYFWKSEADCMVSGASKLANRRKTYQ